MRSDAVELGWVLVTVLLELSLAVDVEELVRDSVIDAEWLSVVVDEESSVDVDVLETSEVDVESCWSDETEVDDRVSSSVVVEETVVDVV